MNLHFVCSEDAKILVNGLVEFLKISSSVHCDCCLCFICHENGKTNTCLSFSDLTERLGKH